MPRVFISHSSLDNEFVEKEIVSFLTRYGIEIWYSKDDIESTTEWEKQIKLGLKACDWFLVVLSPYSVASDWVRCEVDWALEERRGRVIPVLYRTCDPTDLHLKLRRIQYIDFRWDRETARNKLLAIWKLNYVHTIENEEPSESPEKVDRGRVKAVSQKAALDLGEPQLPIPQINNAVDLNSNVDVEVAATRPVTGLSERIWKAKWWLGGIGFLLILIIVNSIYSSLSSKLVETRLENAIAQNNIFGPPSENAFELYRQLKNNGESQSVISRYDEKLLPVLTAPINKLMTDINPPIRQSYSVEEWENASKHLEWAIQIKPADNLLVAQKLYCDGYIAYLKENYDQALERMQLAITKDTSLALPHNTIGIIFITRRDYITSRQYFRNAISLKPDWAVPYNNLGTSYYYTKDYDQAEGYYRQAVARATGWARPHAWLGDIAMAREDYQTAAQEFQTVLDLSASDTNLNTERIRERLEKAKAKLTR